MFGIFESIRHYGKFLFNKEAADRGFDNSVFNDSGGGCVGAVSGAERVVYINFGVVCKRFTERFVFLFLFPVKTEIFQKHRFSAFEIVALSLCVSADYVASKSYFAA